CSVAVLLAAPSHAAITLTFKSPGSGALIRGDLPLDLLVGVTSDFDVTSVVMAYGSQSTPLAHCAGCSASTGRISIDGFPAGPLTFTATVTDVRGNQGQASVTSSVVRPPVISVQSPSAV